MMSPIREDQWLREFASAIAGFLIILFVAGFLLVAFGDALF